MKSGRSALLGMILATGSALCAQAAELIMVEQPGCHWCERWDEEIAHIYPKTEEGARAPLRRVNLRDLPEDLSFRSPPVFTPTFVLMEKGQELSRMEGYSGDEFFWFLLADMLEKNARHIGVEVTQ